MQSDKIGVYYDVDSGALRLGTTSAKSLSALVERPRTMRILPFGQ
jgi:hypothetical protein